MMAATTINMLLTNKFVHKFLNAKSAVLPRTIRMVNDTSRVTLQLHSARLEEQDSNLAQVEIDEMFCFVSDIGTEVSTNNGVPRWVILLVKLFFDECGNVFLDVVLFQRLRCAIDCVLLHVLCHVGVLDYCFAVRHIAVSCSCTEQQTKR